MCCCRRRINVCTWTWEFQLFNYNERRFNWICAIWFQSRSLGFIAMKIGSTNSPKWPKIHKNHFLLWMNMMPFHCHSNTITITMESLWINWRLSCMGLHIKFAILFINPIDQLNFHPNDNFNHSTFYYRFWWSNNSSRSMLRISPPWKCNNVSFTD